MTCFGRRSSVSGSRPTIHSTARKATDKEKWYGRTKETERAFDYGRRHWLVDVGAYHRGMMGGKTPNVIPSLHVDYKGTRIKQYHKGGQALRTEIMYGTSISARGSAISVNYVRSDSRPIGIYWK